MKAQPDFVQCYFCHKFYEKLAPTLKEQRALAEEDGWRVAVAEWKWHSRMSRELWNELHPDRKRNKVDTCPECALEQMRKAMAAIATNFHQPE